MLKALWKAGDLKPGTLILLEADILHSVKRLVETRPDTVEDVAEATEEGVAK